MAVNYTKLFTIMGTYIDKIIDYYALVSTFTTDQASVETKLSAQSVVYLEGDLGGLYDGLKSNVSGWTDQFKSRIDDLLTDSSLVTSNFAFGAEPSAIDVLTALVPDMTTNTKSVLNSTATIGTPVVVSTLTTVGELLTYNRLDGIQPPKSGAPVLVQNTSRLTQLTPVDETIVFTCTQDKETGATQGAEPFNVLGTGAGSSPFSPTGENIGSAGSVQVADSQAGQWIANPYFESWNDDGTPTGWTIIDGVAATDYEQIANEEFGGTSALSYLAVGDLALKQALDPTQIPRHLGFLFSVWIKQTSVAGGDNAYALLLADDDDSTLTTLFTSSSATLNTWTNLHGGFVIPAIIPNGMNLVLSVTGSDPCLVKNVVITPITYIAGCGFAIVGGPNAFLTGDTITVRLQNDCAGKFQSVIAKLYGIQLITNGSPTISDSLVA